MLSPHILAGTQSYVHIVFWRKQLSINNPSCKASGTQADTAVNHHIMVCFYIVQCGSGKDTERILVICHKLTPTITAWGSLKLGPANVTKSVPCIWAAEHIQNMKQWWKFLLDDQMPSVCKCVSMFLYMCRFVCVGIGVWVVCVAVLGRNQILFCCVFHRVIVFKVL